MVWESVVDRGVQMRGPVVAEKSERKSDMLQNLSPRSRQRRTVRPVGGPQSTKSLGFLD